MRAVITYTFAAILMLAFTFNAEAQLLKRLKKKAEDAVEKKAEEKISSEIERRAEQMVEKSWNSIFGDIEGSGEEGNRNPIFKLNSNVATEDSYRFNTVTTMKIETVDNNGKTEPPVFMDMHFNDDGIYTGTGFSGEGMDQQQGDVFIIYDFKNSAMIMLMNSEDEKFSYAYEWQNVLQQVEEMEEDVTYEDGPADNEPENWEGYTKIGSKNIAGYSCDGYRSENEHTVTDIWVSREANFGMSRMFQANANAKQLRGKIPADYPNGMLMEMETKNQKSGEKTIMKVTNIKENVNVIYEMSDYPAMSFGGK
ncbi:MAG TPA: DUF4412 domain-containing protein [Halalkalibaculum sp.]|nr:DUF4412 domain-containing protein [Halalkalibaculum sp.]